MPTVCKALCYALGDVLGDKLCSSKTCRVGMHLGLLNFAIDFLKDLGPLEFTSVLLSPSHKPLPGSLYL